MSKIGKVNGKYVVITDTMTYEMDRNYRTHENGIVRTVNHFDTLAEAVKSANFNYELLSGSYLWSDDYYEPIDFKAEYKPVRSYSFFNQYVR